MYEPPGKKSADQFTPLFRVLGLIILLGILLFMITKFNYISCNDVPGWCPVYCTFAGRDRIAVIYSSNGSGDYNALQSMLTGQSGTDVYKTLYSQIYRNKALSLDYFDLKGSSATLLSKYNLLIFTHVDQVSPSELNDITTYVSKGGKIIVTGNSLVNVQLTQSDLDALAVKNKSLAGSYEKALKSSMKITPFGTIGTLGGFSYIEEVNNSADFVISDPSYVPLRGFQNTITGVPGYVKVSANSGLNIPAFMGTGDTRDPAIIESKIGGARIIYVAFPLENFPSQVLALNMIDYYAPCSTT